jgi:hypothetical protein
MKESKRKNGECSTKQIHISLEREKKKKRHTRRPSFSNHLWARSFDIDLWWNTESFCELPVTTSTEIFVFFLKKTGHQSMSKKKTIQGDSI